MLNDLFYDHHHPILPSTMSLLTPTDAITFQTFLSSVDYTESYNGPTPAEWMLLHHGVRHPDDPEPPRPEAPKLKKATLDLMSLDISATNGLHSSGPWHKSSALPKQPHPYPMQADRDVPSDRPALVIENVRQIYPPYSSSSNSPPSAGVASPSSTSPYPSTTSDVLRSSSSRLPTRSSSKRSFDTVSSSVPAQPSASTSYSSSVQRTKRSRQSTPPLQRASDPSQSSISSSSSSRQPVQTQEGTTSSSRSQLLSASQKRANHIQSEQKRRANIRRGYEALCDTIPALREAIRKEEEEAAAVLANAGGGSSRNAARKKKAKNNNDDGEKLDGRAGPRSENIVLQKSRDYPHIPMLYADFFLS